MDYIEVFTQELIDKFSKKALMDRIAQYITNMVIILSIEYKL